MMETPHFSIGVLAYTFTLDASCSVQPALPVEAQLSFELSGNFLTAACTDSLTDTIDYDALCVAIRHALTAGNCANKEAWFATAVGMAREFSPLVTGGYVKMKFCCHDTFILEAALL